MKTFRRGVHAPDKKELSAGVPIKEVLPGSVMTYPLSQHIGAPAVPAVAPGDRVLKGQVIATAASFVSSPVHSSVSGTVRAIAPALTLKGENENCIIIDSDGLYETGQGFGDRRDVSEMPSADIIGTIKDAGIVGLGGAGFPMHVKLAVKEPETIDYLIVNGSECEPYLTSDYRLMLEQGEKLLRGLRLLIKLFPKAECVIGIENNKKDAIAYLSGLCRDEKRIRVETLKTKYPQGGERMLIYAVTGRKLNSSLLPAQVGCVVVNVASVLAADDALEFGIPLIKRVMTVTGDAVNTPCNLLVSIGDSYAHIIEACGGFNCEPEKVLSGGPMMGIAMFNTDIPVVKTSASVLAFKRDPVALHDMSPCIRCGGCAHVCPEKLVPQLLSKASDDGDFEMFEKYGGMECIECGCCAFVCPAKRPIVQSMRYGKRETGAIIRARRAAGEVKK